MSHSGNDVVNIGLSDEEAVGSKGPVKVNGLLSTYS
jgi:hypothetical protein